MPIPRVRLAAVLLLASCVSDPANPIHEFVAPVRLTIHFQGTGHGRVTSDGGFIDCTGEPCSHDYLISIPRPDEVVTLDILLHAVPDQLSSFAGWVGGQAPECVGTSPDTHVHLELDYNWTTQEAVALGTGCDAIFTAIPLTLSVSPTSQTALVAAGNNAAPGSATVTLGGPPASTTTWNAVVTSTTPPGESWLQLTTSSGVGSGTVQWNRNTASLTAGAHTATLTITAGTPPLTATITDQVTITTSLAIQRSPSGVALVGATAVAFTATLPGAPAGTTYAWDFGDGTVGQGAAPAPHVFNTDPHNGGLNTLTVSVVARDASNAIIGSVSTGQDTRSLVGTWTLFDANGTQHSPTETMTITAVSGAQFQGTNTVSGTIVRDITGTVANPFGVSYTRWGDAAHTVTNECESLTADLGVSPNTLTGNIVDCTTQAPGRAVVWKRG